MPKEPGLEVVDIGDTTEIGFVQADEGQSSSGRQYRRDNRLRRSVVRPVGAVQVAFP